jgi:hypothetical protein
MGVPRIGRADVRAAHNESRQWRPGPRPLEVAARASEIADSLALLTRLVPSVGRRVSRSKLELRARVDRIHDEAIALWSELAKVAKETSA